MPIQLEILVRLYAKERQEAALFAVLVAHLAEVRMTSGCLVIHDYVSIRDPRLLYIHSRWASEAAFENEESVEQALRSVHGPTAREPDCLAHEIYRCSLQSR